MFAPRIRLKITAPTAPLLAFRQVKSQANHLILGAAVILALAVGACGGTAAAPTFLPDSDDGEATRGATGIRVETAPVSTSTPLASPDPISSPRTGGLDYGPANEFDLVARTFGEAIHNNPHDSRAYNGRAA